MDLSEFEAEIKAKAELNKEAAADRGQAHFNRLVNEKPRRIRCSQSRNLRCGQSRLYRQAIFAS